MFNGISAFIGVYVLLTVGCIVKKIKHYNIIDWNFLWLILYNDVLSFLSVYALSIPDPNYPPQSITAYYPGEFIIFTTVPLILVGFVMKIVFLCEKKQEDDYHVNSSWGSIWYVIISAFPALFTLGTISDRLISLSMWMPLNIVVIMMLTLLLPLLPRIIVHIRKRR